MIAKIKGSSIENKVESEIAKDKIDALTKKDSYEDYKTEQLRSFEELIELKKQEEDLEELKEEQEEEFEDLNEAQGVMFELLKEEILKKLEKMQEMHEKAIEGLEGLKAEELKKEQETEIAELKTEIIKELEEMKEKYELEFDELEKKHEQEIVSLQESYQHPKEYGNHIADDELNNHEESSGEEIDKHSEQTIDDKLAQEIHSDLSEKQEAEHVDKMLKLKKFTFKHHSSNEKK